MVNAVNSKHCCCHPIYLHVLLWEKYCMILYSSLIHVCLHTLKNTVVSMYSYAKVGLLHRHRMKLSQFLSFLKLSGISRLHSTNYATDTTSSSHIRTCVRYIRSYIHTNITLRWLLMWRRLFSRLTERCYADGTYYEHGEGFQPEERVCVDCTCGVSQQQHVPLLTKPDFIE